MLKVLCKEKKVVAIFLASVLLFLYYLNVNYKVNYYDENGYINISKSILAQGLFNINEPLRTYLYPLIISIISIFTNSDIVLIKIGMSILQYLFYIYTICLVGKKTYEYCNQKTVYYGILFFGLLNPYLIQSTTLFLTDLMSTCCVILALVHITFGDFYKNKTYLMIFLYSYIGTMIRPSTIIFIPIIIFLLIIRKYTIKDVNIIKSVMFASCALVIFFPQLYNNVKQFNDWTPLVHTKLYEFQSHLAASNLKYASVVIPNESAQLFYPSPYQIDSSTSGIFELMYTNFPAFLTAYFSHMFGVLDWGYIETYINDFYPISRIIGSLFLYSFWIAAFYGVYVFIRKNKSIAGKFIAISFISSFILYWGFIGTTIIESRFGYPLYILMLPFSGWGVQCCLDYWRSESINKSLKLIKTVKYLLVFIIVITLTFYLSFLLDYQTGRINWLGF
ncbi:hypothetical protein ACP8HI_25580 [Paenibacillus sp. FA6]|uniref:hypothetical protein n=1 Tax=Paenibacillus sp. FA6 TaxID=3413029 RepID=UPI003F65CB13